jgi:uncharacterized protein YraI
MSPDYPSDPRFPGSPQEGPTPNSSHKGAEDATLPGGGQPLVRLRMQLGPAIGQVYTMVGNLMTMGRAQDNDIVLDDPQVSRYHAQVIRQGKQIIVEDLGSTNGTFVNGRRITGPHVLQPTETIAVGSSVFSVEGFSAPDTVGVPPYRKGTPPAPDAPPARPLPRPKTSSDAKPERTPWLAIGWVGGLLIIVVLILTLAGLTAWLLTRDRVQVTPTTPSVFIQSPVAGSQVPINQPVTVNATASDPNGITRAELWVGGNVVDQQESAIPEGQPTFPVTMHWTPTVAGSYTLEVRAYNSLDVASAPTTVMITAAGAAQEQGNVPTPTTPGETPTASGPPLAVTTTDLNVREGPGQEYPVLGLLPVTTQVEVSGKNLDGSWWQIVYPNGSAGQGWIFAAFTRPSNTENVPVVQTPVPPTPTQTPTVSPTATPSPTASPTTPPTVTLTPTPTAAAPIVEFRATETTVNPGGCTTLQWHIEYVTAAYLSGGEFSNYGVTGPFGQIDTCPAGTTTYVLRAETASGRIERSVTVTVRSEQTTTLNHIGGGSVREDGQVFAPQPIVGDNDTDQALRAFLAFDLSSLSNVTITSAQLKLNDYTLSGDPFGELAPLLVEEVDWGSTLEAADYDAPAKATLANLGNSAGLDNSIDVTSRVISRLEGGNNTFRIRMRLETPTNGDGSGDSISWAGRTAQLIIRYY